MQQLSNAEAFMDPDNPSHAVFTPALLSGELEGKFVVNAACGEEHSVVVAQERRDGKPVKELVYACGNNLKGQLGINRSSHLQDFTLVEDLSEMYDGLDEHQKPLHITHLSCGKRHCLAALDFGAFFFWGDNESGQLGNRKRSFVESPFPKRKFELNHNVENVVCGLNSSAVIVEALPPRPKKKKYQKRVLTLDDIRSMSEDRIKQENEAKLAAAKRKAADDEEKEKEEIAALQRRVPMQERFRKKWHQLTFGHSERETWNDASKRREALKQITEEKN